MLTGRASSGYVVRTMKEGIHPDYYANATAICACGTTFTVGSTKPEIRVEICSACHPFTSGQKKLIDTRGRVGRFVKITEKAALVKAARTQQKAAPRKKKKLEVITEKQWKKLA